jgi:hypothetical protein
MLFAHGFEHHGWHPEGPPGFDPDGDVEVREDSAQVLGCDPLLGAGSAAHKVGGFAEIDCSVIDTTREIGEVFNVIIPATGWAGDGSRNIAHGLSHNGSFRNSLLIKKFMKSDTAIQMRITRSDLRVK